MCVPADPLNANQPLRELSLNGVKLFEKNLDLLSSLRMVKFTHSLAVNIIHVIGAYFKCLKFTLYSTKDMELIAKWRAIYYTILHAC